MGDLDLNNQIDIGSIDSNTLIEWTLQTDIGFNLIGRIFLPMVERDLEKALEANLQEMKKELEIKKYNTSEQLKGAL